MKKYRGVIHFHSKCSHDSIASIDGIIDEALKYHLNFLLITDHDTVLGSQRLRERIKQRKLNIEVPIAAEYKTEYGDVISAFLEDEIVFLNFEDLVAKTKASGGLILFPHPYHDHQRFNHIAENADLVEVFNSRQSISQDEQALKLAIDHEKKIYFSPDAHYPSGLSNCIVEFDDLGSLKKSLLEAEIKQVTSQKTRFVYIRLSQIIKDFKKKNYKRVIISPLYFVNDFLKGRF